MSFIKNDKIFFLQKDGKIISIDKNSGVIIDNIAIDKDKFSELHNLHTASIINFNDSNILIYYDDFLHTKEKENRKVIFVYNVDNYSVEKKFMYDNDSLSPKLLFVMLYVFIEMKSINWWADDR